MGFDKQALFQQANQSVLEGNQEKATELTQHALDNGVGAKEILDRGLVPGMDVVGARFRDGDMFLPEVLLAARAMKAGMQLLKSELSKTGFAPAGKVVIGTVAGDMHDIGKNIVMYMLEGAGFEVIDLGINVGAETFMAKVREHQPHILGMSAFLTTTMPAMKEVVEHLEHNNLRDSLKVILGGAPVTSRYAEEIGADAFAGDATAAVAICRQMMKGS